VRTKLLILHGTEYRAFVLSGLFAQLRNDGLNPEIVSRRRLPDCVESVVLDDGFRHTWNLGERWTRELADSCWVSRGGVLNRRHRLGGGPAAHLLPAASSLAYTMHDALLRGMPRVKGISFDEGDCVITGSHNSPYAFPILVAALRAGARVVLVPNSEKDLYVTVYAPVRFESTFVPRSTSEAKVLPSRFGEVIMIRSLHLAGLIPDAIHGLASNVAYTLAPRKVFPAELEVARAIARRMAVDDRLKQLKLVVRVNPFDEADVVRAALADETNVRVMAPDWDVDLPNEWYCPTAGDQRAWSNLISSSLCNISVASTVTQEFSSLGKRTIKAQWDSLFYGDIRRAFNPVAARSLDEVVRAMTNCFEAPPGPLESAGCDSLREVSSRLNAYRSCMP
jgi:hypothetical protein